MGPPCYKIRSLQVPGECRALASKQLHLQLVDKLNFLLKLKHSPSSLPRDLLPLKAAECSTEPLKRVLEKSTADTWEILWQHCEADKQRRGERRGEKKGIAFGDCLAAKSALEISVGSLKAFPNIKNVKKKKKFWSMTYCPWSKQKNPSQSEITEICFIVMLKFSMFWQLGLMLLAGLFASLKIFITELPGFCPFKLSSNDEGEGAREILSMSFLP